MALLHQDICILCRCCHCYVEATLPAAVEGVPPATATLLQSARVAADAAAIATGNIDAFDAICKQFSESHLQGNQEEGRAAVHQQDEQGDQVGRCIHHVQDYGKTACPVHDGSQVVAHWCQANGRVVICGFF